MITLFIGWFALATTARVKGQGPRSKSLCRNVSNPFDRDPCSFYTIHPKITMKTVLFFKIADFLYLCSLS